MAIPPPSRSAIRSTEVVEPIDQGRGSRKSLADLANRVVTSSLASKRLVLLRPGDDLGVQPSQLLGEFEVVFGEGVRPLAVMEVEDTEDLAFADQGNTERRLHVESFANDPEALPVGPSAQADGAGIGRHAPGDALSKGDLDLGPELRLHADGDADRQQLGLRIQEHQRAAVRAGHAHGDLQHAREQLVSVDGEVDGLDDLVQGLEKLRLPVRRRDAVSPEQPRGERRDDLHAS